MQPSENWGPSHRNLERLQRRSISSSSRKNSSVRRDPTAGTGTTTSTSSTVKLQQQQQQNLLQNPKQNLQPLAQPLNSILIQSNGANSKADTQKSAPKSVSILNGGPSTKAVPLSKAKANRPSPLTMMPTLPPPSNYTGSGNSGNGGDCSSSSSELTTVTPTNLSVKSASHVVVLEGGGGSGGHTPTFLKSKPGEPSSSQKKSFDNPFFDSVGGYRQQPTQPHQLASRNNSDANKETRI